MALRYLGRAWKLPNSYRLLTSVHSYHFSPVAMASSNSHEDLRKNDFFKKKIRRTVEVFDTNKNGRITLADYELVVKNYKDLGISEKHLEVVKKVMKQLSDVMGLTDHSKSISYEEFEEIYLKNLDKMRGHTQDLFSGAFQMIDTNETGWLSLEEWENYYKAAGIDTKHAKESFNAMDKNGNGKVTKEEFIAFNDEYFYTTENKLNSAILYGPLD